MSIQVRVENMSHDPVRPDVKWPLVRRLLKMPPLEPAKVVIEEFSLIVGDGEVHPRWAETFVERERQVRLPVACGPCQLKKCPIDHRCMTGVTVEMVISAAKELWAKPKIADWRDEPDVDPRSLQ